MKKYITVATSVIVLAGILNAGCEEDSRNFTPEESACKTGGFVRCDGVCIDPMTSRNFCGADVSCSSYIPCSEFEKCIDGKCVPSSCQNAEESLCTIDEQTICVNIHGNHPNHCGGCGYVCNDKETAKAAGCSHGQCIYTCMNGAVNCGSDTDPMCLSKDQLKSDPLHCGNCDTSCKANELCQNGQCIISACMGNECFYHNACINQNDHCGTQCLNCNTANHASAGVCQNGSCVITSCIAGYHLTSEGLCEPDSDTCCGTACWNCDADSSCIDGSCQKECLTFTEPGIGNYAFANWDTNHNGCISRSEAEAVTEIPEKAFYNNTNLKSLADLEQFPNLTTIGDSAFEGCSGLTSVSLPQTTHIGDSAFSGGTHIASIDLPQVTYIGNRAFVGGVSEHDYDKGLVHEECNGHHTDCSYGYGYGIIREIIQNTSLTSVNLPQVTYIGDEAFSGCTSLTSVDLPQATYIGERAFVGGVNENDYHVKIYESHYDGVNGEYYSSEYIEPDMSYVKRWITENTGLTSVNLPKATHIGDYAFSGCTGLTSVDLPQATHIGDYAFAGGVSATVWYDGREINMSILENTSLTSIDLPKATYIGDYAFSGCTGLTSVNLPQATHIGDGAFVGGKFQFFIYSGHYDYTFSDLYEYGENTSLASVSLPKATYIGGSAFAHCTGLTSIDLPQATEIGAWAFTGCTGLSSIDLPKATSIGNDAFYGCTSLSSLALTSSDKITLSNGVFLGFTLDKVTLTLHQNKAVGGSSSPLCTSATEWAGKTWKEIRFVQ